MSQCLLPGASKPGLDPAAELLLALPKSNQKASPWTPLLPPVLATAGRRRNRPNVALRATGGLMLRRLDRPLLRSSARAKGAVDLKFDRSAMEAHTTRTRFASPGYSNYSNESVASMQRSGIEDWWQDGETPTSGINSVPHRSPGASTRVRASYREAIKHRLDGVPMDSPRGAQRQAVQAAQHEPTGVVARSACHASGDFCDARLTRAPQETGESSGSPFLGYLFWRSKKGNCPARHERAGGTRNLRSRRNHPPFPDPALQAALAQACARRSGGGSHASRNPAFPPRGARGQREVPSC